VLSSGPRPETGVVRPRRVQGSIVAHNLPEILHDVQLRLGL
jgi:hypothetical protein